MPTPPLSLADQAGPRFRAIWTALVVICCAGFVHSIWGLLTHEPHLQALDRMAALQSLGASLIGVSLLIRPLLWRRLLFWTGMVLMVAYVWAFVQFVSK